MPYFSPFEVLGATSEMSDYEISKMYHAAVLRHHPDKGGCAEACIIVTWARDELCNPKSKRLHLQAVTPRSLQLRLCGLVNRPELNGQVGRMLSCDGLRVKVQLDSQVTPVSVTLASVDEVRWSPETAGAGRILCASFASAYGQSVTTDAEDSCSSASASAEVGSKRARASATCASSSTGVNSAWATASGASAAARAEAGSGCAPASGASAASCDGVGSGWATARGTADKPVPETEPPTKKQRFDYEAKKECSGYYEAKEEWSGHSAAWKEWSGYYEAKEEGSGGQSAEKRAKSTELELRRRYYQNVGGSAQFIDMEKRDMKIYGKMMAGLLRHGRAYGACIRMPASCFLAVSEVVRLLGIPTDIVHQLVFRDIDKQGNKRFIMDSRDGESCICATSKHSYR